jgi:hypothetical protein
MHGAYDAAQGCRGLRFGNMGCVEGVSVSVWNDDKVRPRVSGCWEPTAVAEWVWE